MFRREKHNAAIQHKLRPARALWFGQFIFGSSVSSHLSVSRNDSALAHVSLAGDSKYGTTYRSLARSLAHSYSPQFF